MTEALPVAYVLVKRNLAVFAAELLSLDPLTADGRTRLVSRHLAWIHAVTEEMARTGAYTIGLRSLPAPPRQVSRPPFSNTGRVVPMTAHAQEQRQFVQAFALALRALEPEIDFEERVADKRSAWISRWIASAALTAHVQLIHGEQTPTWFAAVESPLGEDSAASEAALLAFISECSPKVICLLPQYKQCEFKLAGEWRDAIKSAIDTIESPQAIERDKYKAQGLVANLLAYLTSNPPSEIEIKNWPRHRHERAKQLLIVSGICQSTEDASQALRKIRIGNSFDIRREFEDAGAKAPAQARFPTKGAEHAASHRGRLIYAKMWARLVAESGLLTPPLVTATWPSSPAQNAISAEFFDVSLSKHASSAALSGTRKAEGVAETDTLAPLPMVPAIKISDK